MRSRRSNHNFDEDCGRYQRFCQCCPQRQIDPSFSFAPCFTKGAIVEVGRYRGPAFAACRDPTDDKFLDVAVNGLADIIVSGDADLLVLHPFRGVPIVSPAAFIREASFGE